MKQQEAEKISTIFGWNFERVALILERDGVMHEPDIAEGIEEYKKFLAIHIAFPQVPHPISKQVDDVWHAHVLDSKDYARFSQLVFGRFFHHNPVLEPEGQAELRRGYEIHTLPHLAALFGTPSKKFWGEARVICIGEGGGGQGNCESPMDIQVRTICIGSCTNNE